MMDRLEKFLSAREKTRDALDRAPYMFPLESVISQLDYLIALERGEQADRSDLKSISIGQIAARDIDNFDPLLAELLHDVSAEVQNMLKKQFSGPE
jgi:hypothetical protein